ncbi:glycosyltransferase [Flavobacterium sp. NG2]|uniref:glycosyltransferase n=1 Tax=Flavobacterium sp. NG2 TaxID=3097547 RepID=UPI002A82A0A0|nr:glycosyltransferase [Flavobacterium sp. NG2]WPR71604.1 glycosyltransferase [Flavobacterium sp. NG2]
MRILMVSMPSLHFFRWTDQLKDSGHEVFWFDIKGAGEMASSIHWVHQNVDWKLKYDYPGRYLFKMKFSKLYRWLQQYNEKDTALAFEKYLQEVRPDAVHSFALYVSCTPIVEVMQRHKNIKWIYSSWGSDLFYFQDKANYLYDIKRVLNRVDCLFTDCKRDYEIAKQHGFLGQFLGVFPGGGGFDMQLMEKFKLPIEQRKIILIKGFQGRSGRAIPVLKAIISLKERLSHFNIVVFGTDLDAIDYINSSELIHWSNFKAIGKITYQEVLKLMGQALIYIGNSNSDGIPNTLLEALCMDVFPIQSNPGGATAEIIIGGVNGLLIENAENIIEIKQLVLEVISDISIIEKGVVYNSEIIRPTLEYQNIKDLVMKKYDLVDILLN